MKTKMNKVDLWTKVLFVLLMISMFLFMITDFLLFKVLASACFVAAGFLKLFENQRMTDWKNVIRDENSKYALWLFLGLVLAFLGDVAIAFSFIAGAAFFVLTHFSYMRAFHFLRKFEKTDIWIALLIAFCSTGIIFFAPFLKREDSMMLVTVLAYAVVISFMVGKALGNMISMHDRRTFLICIASIGFFISDMMLLFHAFTDPQEVVFLSICRCTYFPSQYLLAILMTKEL